VGGRLIGYYPNFPVEATLALMGSPQKRTPVSSTEEIANIVTSGDEMLSSMQLTEWQVGGLPGVTVVDVRPADAYMQYSISGSVNIPLRTLMTREGMSQLPKYDRIVLVSLTG